MAPLAVRFMVRLPFSIKDTIKVRDVFCMGHIFQILKARIATYCIFVINLVPSWARPQEGRSNQSVNSVDLDFSIFGEAHPQISRSSGALRFYQPIRNAMRSPFRLISQRHDHSVRSYIKARRDFSIKIPFLTQFSAARNIFGCQLKRNPYSSHISHVAYFIIRVIINCPPCLYSHERIVA